MRRAAGLVKGVVGVAAGVGANTLAHGSVSQGSSRSDTENQHRRSVDAVVRPAVRRGRRSRPPVDQAIKAVVLGDLALLVIIPFWSVISTSLADQETIIDVRRRDGAVAVGIRR